MRAQDSRKFTLPCRGCGNGCTLIVVEDEYGGQVFGNHCRKGDVIGREAWRDAQGGIFRGRLRVAGRLLPMRVRTTGPVAARDHARIRAFLRTQKAAPPVQAGAVLVKNVLELGVNLISDQSKN